MIDNLIATLERINKLPLDAEERAELMRALIQESRRDGSIQRRPGPKVGGKESFASKTLAAMREIGDWTRPRDIAAHMGVKSGPVSVALKDLVVDGRIERRESEERLSNGRIIYYYRATAL
jgi:hypothetical protein